MYPWLFMRHCPSQRSTFLGDHAYRSSCWTLTFSWSRNLPFTPFPSLPHTLPNSVRNTRQPQNGRVWKVSFRCHPTLSDSKFDFRHSILSELLDIVDLLNHQVRFQHSRSCSKQLHRLPFILDFIFALQITAETKLTLTYSKT